MSIKNKYTNQSTPTRVFRNIHAAANHRAVNATGSIVARGIEKTAKWVATDHVGTAERSDLMALQQDASFIIAKMTLANRRANRNNSNILTFIAGWVIDYGLYIFDLLWGFIWPILLFIAWSLLSAILIAAFIGITFYVLFQLLIL